MKKTNQETPATKSEQSSPLLPRLVRLLCFWRSGSSGSSLDGENAEADRANTMLAEKKGCLQVGVNDQHGVVPKVKVYDTGLSETELKTLRSFIRLKYPQMDGPLLFPSKDSVPVDQMDLFEFCQASNASEFHASHRRLHILAKQYMDYRGNPKAHKFALLEKEVQDLLKRECA